MKGSEGEKWFTVMEIGHVAREMYLCNIMKCCIKIDIKQRLCYHSTMKGGESGWLKQNLQILFLNMSECVSRTKKDWQN